MQGLRFYTVLIFISSAMALAIGCAPDKKKRGARASRGFSVQYQFQVNDCTTGVHRFTSGESLAAATNEMCEALQNSALNQNCAPEDREDHFEAFCSGQTWTPISGTAPPVAGLPEPENDGPTLPDNHTVEGNFTSIALESNMSVFVGGTNERVFVNPNASSGSIFLPVNCTSNPQEVLTTDALGIVLYRDSTVGLNRDMNFELTDSSTYGDIVATPYALVNCDFTGPIDYVFPDYYEQVDLRVGDSVTQNVFTDEGTNLGEYIGYEVEFTCETSENTIKESMNAETRSVLLSAGSSVIIIDDALNFEYNSTRPMDEMMERESPAAVVINCAE